MHATDTIATAGATCIKVCVANINQIDRKSAQPGCLSVFNIIVCTGRIIMILGLVTVVLGSIVGWLLAPVVASAGLLAWGFGAAGPIAGTAAAAFQASVGNVVVGSIFALCQSIAMSGLSMIGYVVGGVIGGGLSYVGAWIAGLF